MLIVQDALTEIVCLSSSLEDIEGPDPKKAKEDANELSLYRHLMESRQVPPE